MSVDPKKLKDFQKELEDRTNLTKDWINVQKLASGEGIDIRVLDPLANMNGLYFLEVAIWWINGNKIISPTVFSEPDIVKEVIDEAKSQDDPDINKLLKAVGANGPKIQNKTEYWMPVLQFNWKFEGDEIIGIHDANKVPDVTLIEKFITDHAPKILACGPTMMKAINHEATVRGGYVMMDREKGFNLYIEKGGSGKNTTYKASKMDQLPMPEKYYGEGKTPDLLLMCKAAMRTDAYMENVICNYLYGDAPIEKDDTTYRYPEANEALKAMKQAAEPVTKPIAATAEPAVESTTAKPEPTEAAAPTAEPVEEPVAESAAEEPAAAPAAEPTEPAAEEPAAAPAVEKSAAPATRPSGRPGRGGAPAAKPATGRPGRGARNVAQDLKDVKDE